LNVIDVYNIAASTGKEFERLTDAFGGVVFSGAMPKIIRILEMFEELVKSREEKDTKISSLQQEVSNYDTTLKMRNITFSKEMAELQSAWEENGKELKKRNRRLEDDNKKLVSILNQHDENNKDEHNYVVQMQSINKLQEDVKKLKEDNRNKSRLINEHAGDCAALQAQVDRLAKLNSDLRSKVSILQQQAATLINEKSSLQSSLNNNKLDIRQILKTEEKQQQNAEGGGGDNNQKSPSQSPSPTQPRRSECCDDPLLANKLMIDLTDPNRPRYTLEELLEVLNDRNQLKARCFRLEEELIFYKDVSRKLGYAGESWEEITSQDIRQMNNLQISENPETNGIRKFFAYLWGLRDASSSSRNSSPKPIRKTKQSTYHEGRNHLVNDTEVCSLAPRVHIHEKAVVSSSELLPISTSSDDDVLSTNDGGGGGDDDEDSKTVDDDHVTDEGHEPSTKEVVQ